MGTRIGLAARDRALEPGYAIADIRRLGASRFACGSSGVVLFDLALSDASLGVRSPPRAWLAPAAGIALDRDRRAGRAGASDEPALRSPSRGRACLVGLCGPSASESLLDALFASGTPGVVEDAVRATPRRYRSTDSSCLLRRWRNQSADHALPATDRGGRNHPSGTACGDPYRGFSGLLHLGQPGAPGRRDP